ncbi:MAG TPA: NfeD family protein [Devosiaceae bacterium]
MDLLNLFLSYGPWSWVIVGIVLLAIELVAPGGVFVWLGAAAIVTGLLVLLAPIGWPLQFVVFGVLSVAGISAWLVYVRGRGRSDTDRPFLNRRAEANVGREAVLTEPIRNGFGQIELGDSVWRVSGPELPAGQRVRVVGNSGTVLAVEAVERIDA